MQQQPTASHNVPVSSSMAVPRHLPALRLALASIYSLPVQPGQQLPSPTEVHDFLMLIQSRNARRKIRSVQQQFRDQGADDTNSSKSFVVETVHMGSSWLACLALLCRRTNNNHQFEASSTERLFAAQTLLHRLRRVKIVEAVDIELEYWSDTNDKAWLLQCYENSSHIDHLATNYQHWMVQCCNSHFVAQVLANASLDPSADEDRLKAELTVLTLAAIAYMQACDQSTSEHERTPLLSTTLSALATAIFRLRYDVQTINSTDQQQQQQQQQQQPALVSMVQHAFQVVWQTARQDANTANHDAYTAALFMSLAILPDCIIGSPGGARRRLSVDPKALRAASQDLRKVDTQLLADILIQTTQHQANNGQEQQQQHRSLWILQACAKWASFLPLTIPLLLLTVPLVNHCLVHDHHQSVAFAFFIAIYESGSWTVEEILSSAMGMSDHQMIQQQTKKKQSTRSKKRQKERIENNKTDTTMEEAKDEKKLRGEIACQLTVECWAVLSAAAQAALVEAEANDLYQVEGEGPIGCLAACANACLPHILRHPSTLHGRELFLNTTKVFQQICASSQKTIRALALEPLYTLHSVLLDVIETAGPLEKELESIVVSHLFQCSMSTASVCGYPATYFDALGAESDHDLEIERNDARDLLRTVAGSGEGGSTVNTDSTKRPLETTTRVLARLVEACKESISPGNQQPESFPEPAVHALSSLAKPLNHLSKCYSKYGGTDDVRDILGSVLQSLLAMNQMVVAGFHEALPLRTLLPSSRIVNLANASFAPFLCALASLQDEEIANGLIRMIDSALHGAILSLEQLPELCAPSILHYSQYDIRGTMRGPGGEDHVGVLTIMRFAFEDDALVQKFVHCCAPYMSRLCDLHQTLKQVEWERGKDVMHGRGVTPQTRRILVGAICHVELSSQGQLGASTMLSNLFGAAIAAIVRFQSKATFSEQEMFEITETVLDLASFSPAIVGSLFTDPLRIGCLETLTTACVNGYQYWRATDAVDPTIPQVR